jgi:undecaprenyl phosphate N,N'-diacetylbacillosamine 1-phosphate transferase
MIYKKIGKRFFDLVLSLFLILFLSPIMFIVFLILIFSNHKPIVFIQKRPGYKERIFKLYKFATMNNNRDENGILWEDAKRITVLGNWLRKTSLDELLQLFNVLKGDMSFVGPRPLLVEYLDKYNAEQKLRHKVKPGITGYAQVNGRNNVSWKRKLELDVYYVRNCNFLFDIKILFQTFYKIFKTNDVSKNGFVTSDKFLGND